jgi:hypothetical protein
MSINISSEQNQLKAMVKEVILELITENKEEFSDLIIEIIEEITLAKAIKEGEETELVDRESIFAILEQK